MSRLTYQHQVDGAQWLIDHPRAILADEMRCGKTRTTALALLNFLPWTIICPASAKTIWRDEIHDLCDARVDVVNGTTHKFDRYSDITIINRDVLASYIRAKQMPLRLLGSTLAVDECHGFSNDEAKRTYIARNFVEHSSRVVALSGTPIPSRIAQLWPMLFALGIVRMDWKAFTRRYAAAWEAPWGWDTRGASNLDELMHLIRPYMLRRTKAEIFGDYIPYESRLITFDRPPDERESQFNIDELAKRDNPLVSVVGLSEIVKASGMLKVPQAIEFISDRIRESEVGKVIVFGYHHDLIDALEVGLQKYNPLKLTGRTSRAKRDSIKDLFKQPKHQVLIAQLIAGGEAYDFSVADTSIFVETDWVPSHVDQAAQRTESMQKLGRCSTAYFLTLEKSIDHVMLRRLFEKSEIIDQVIVPSSNFNQPKGNTMSKVSFYRQLAAAHASIGAAYKAAADDEEKNPTTAAAPVDTAAEAAATKKRGRPAKVADAEDPLAGLAGGGEPEPEETDPMAGLLGHDNEEEPAEPEVTEASLRITLAKLAAAVEVVKGKGKGTDALVALFKKHGASSIKSLDTDKYITVDTEAKTILAAIAAMKK